MPLASLTLNEPLLFVTYEVLLIASGPLVEIEPPELMMFRPFVTVVAALTEN
jgi:hypothetical protein